MKKLVLTLCFICFGTALPADEENPTFWELVNTPIAQKMEPQLKSIKMVYLINGRDIPTGLLMVRANRTGQFRIDSLSMKESFATGGTPEKIWCWDTTSGEHKITEEELNQLESDTSLLPIPFMKRDFFNKPVKEKEETVQGHPCNVWKAVDKSGKYISRIWLDRKDSLVRKVESNADGDVQVILYEQYRIFNGIEMASVIRKIDNQGDVCTLELQTLQWNVKFVDRIFTLPQKGELLTLEREMRNFIRKKPGDTSSEEVKKAPKQNYVVLRMEPKQTRKQKIQRRIARLEIEIQDLEKRQQTSKTVYLGNQNRSSDGGFTRSTTWYSRGFRRTRFSRPRRSSSARYDYQNRQIANDYEWTSRLLTEKKIELKNLQMDLENLENEK